MSTKKSLGAKTLAYPTPAWAIAAYDSDGQANAMVAAWSGICCSVPPCVAVSVRKERYTYKCISERQAFTVNIPDAAHMRELDYLGIYSGKKGDKFAATGLTAVRSELVDAPYIAEFPLVLECRVLHTVEVGGHTQFIGEIMDVKAEESVLVDGRIDAARVNTFTYDPDARQYLALGESMGKAFKIGKELKSQD